MNKAFGLTAIAIFGLTAVTGCASSADSSSQAVPVPTAAGSSADVIYATFHGGKAPGVNTVYGYSATGTVDTNVIQNSPNAPLDEARGMAFDSGGNFYVNSAYKNASQINRYTPLSGGGYGNGITYAPSSLTAGLNHPYGLAVHKSGDLLVTSQDSMVSTRFSTASNTQASVVPTGSAWATNKAVPPGTWAPAVSDNVAASAGGIVTPRDVKVVGDTMYVADSTGYQVKAYNLATGGAFMGVTLDLSKTSPQGGPTGLAVSPDGNYLYVGAQGTNNVLAVAVNGGSCSSGCVSTQVIGSNQGSAVLSHPAGIATTTQNGKLVLYVASQNPGNGVINQYVMSNDTTVQTPSLFVSNLPDTPEQLLAVPTS